MQTIQNPSIKRVNEGIRTPTDTTNASLKPCSSWRSLPPDITFDFLMCNADVYVIKLTVVNILSFLGITKYVAIYINHFSR